MITLQMQDEIAAERVLFEERIADCRYNNQMPHVPTFARTVDGSYVDDTLNAAWWGWKLAKGLE